MSKKENEICLSLEEQNNLIVLINANTQLATKFIANVDEDNITSFPREYLTLIKQAWDASDKLRSVINTIKSNVLKEVQNG